MLGVIDERTVVRHFILRGFKASKEREKLVNCFKAQTGPITCDTLIDAVGQEDSEIMRTTTMTCSYLMQWGTRGLRSPTASPTPYIPSPSLLYLSSTPDYTHLGNICCGQAPTSATDVGVFIPLSMSVAYVVMPSDTELKRKTFCLAGESMQSVCSDISL